MKKPLINHLVLVAAATLVTACTTSNREGTGNANSTIAPAPPTVEMHNTYLTSTCGKQVCMAGYFIDEQSVNHPAVAIGDPINKVWLFPSAITSLFTFQEDSMAASREGVIYRLADSVWLEAELKLQPSSQVVWAGDDILACTKPSKLMLSSQRGYCYAVKGSWSYEYDNAAATPAVCGEQLLLISYVGERHMIRAIKLPDGSVIHEGVWEQPGADLCAITF